MNSNLLIATCFAFCLLSGTTAVAEDFPGGEAPTNFSGEAPTAEFSKGFDTNKGILASEKEALDVDKLKIGGQLMYELYQYRFSGLPIEDWTQNPHTLSIYLDSQLKKGTRFFFKGHMVYDPAIDESILNPLTGVTLKRTESQIEELKLQFQINHKVFVTAGTQKIKWGTGHFWNPTDFLNSEARDFFKSEDQRSGLGLLKFHIPYGNHNFYLIENFEKTNTNRSIGSGARAEIAFDKAEVSLTRYQRKGISSLSGADLSIGIGDFDVVAEAAASDDGTKKSASGGISYEWVYSEDDSAIFYLEGYWNKQGAKDKSEYPALLIAGQWQPFQIAESYQMASVLLMKPGNWNQSTMQLFAVRNQIDESLYYRGTYSWAGIEDLNLTASLGFRNGEDGTEMKMGGLFSDANLSATVNF